MTKQTRELAAKKAASLREFTDRQFKLTDMLAIFGECFKGKFREAPTRHQMIGKNYFSTHGRKQNPPGFKLLRKWFAKSGRSFAGMELSTGKGAVCRFEEGKRTIVVQVNDTSDNRSHGWHAIDPRDWSFRT